MFYYSYRVKGADEVEHEQFDETGILAAETYEDAAHELSEWFGEKNVDEMTVKVLSDGPLKVDQATIDKIAEDVIW